MTSSFKRYCIFICIIFRYLEEQLKGADIWSFGMYFMIFEVFNSIHNNVRGHMPAACFPKYYKERVILRE